MKAVYLFMKTLLMPLMTNLFLLKLIIQLKLYLQLKKDNILDSISPRKSQANGIKILENFVKL